MRKYLHMSKKSSTFAPAFEEVHISVMHQYVAFARRRDGWVAETNSLLNCRTGNRTGGSNPPFSANAVNQPFTAFNVKKRVVSELKDN